MSEPAITLAYRHCEQITRSQARNFYYGIRLLPPQKRHAMCALYAMARRVDDAGDDTTGVSATGTAAEAPGGQDGRLATLAGIRSTLRTLEGSLAGRPGAVVPPGDPVLLALADAARHFPLPLEALSELVEGCEWDV